MRPLIVAIAVIILFCISCKKEPETPKGSNKIELSSTIIETIKTSYVVVNSSVNLGKYGTITDHGFCGGTYISPDLSGSHKSLGVFQNGGSFSSKLTGLLPKTKYYVRSYTKNSYNTVFGMQNEFTTLDITFPVVQTVSIIYSTDTSSICTGNAISDGGGIILARGVCWSTSKDPTISNSHTIDGNGTGPFTSDIKGLNANTTYYLRAYATNSIGTSYGLQVTLNTPGRHAMLDIDGNIYHTLLIGTQLWMAENLKTTKFKNGDTIPYWNNSTSRGYCWYNHDSTYKNTYGALYNYYTSSDSRSICPPGWHIPSVEDWTTLINYLGGDSVAGGKLKEAGTTHWNSPNTGATNIVGFTALPGGARDCSNNFINMGSGCGFWTSLEVTGGWVKGIGIQFNSANISFGSGFDCNASYIRCIKD